MSPLKSVVLIIIFLAIQSCSKECLKIKKENCADHPIHNPKSLGFCQAFYDRWFFDKISNSCVFLNYTGCGNEGFSTQQECEECKCK